MDKEKNPPSYHRDSSRCSSPWGSSFVAVAAGEGRMESIQERSQVPDTPLVYTQHTHTHNTHTHTTHPHTHTHRIRSTELTTKIPQKLVSVAYQACNKECSTTHEQHIHQAHKSHQPQPLFTFCFALTMLFHFCIQSRN